MNINKKEIIMLPYKTSKDYKRLKELLDEGKEIVLLYVIPFQCNNKKGYTTARVENNIYNFSGFMPKYTDKELMDFCEKYNIEFIEPNL